VQLRFAKNQRLPKLDVNLQYRALDIVGRPNPAVAGPPDVPVSALGGWTDSHGRWLEDPREFSAMGIVSIPLGNITARKNVSNPASSCGAPTPR